MRRRATLDCSSRTDEGRLVTADYVGDRNEMRIWLCGFDDRNSVVPAIAAKRPNAQRHTRLSRRSLRQAHPCRHPYPNQNNREQGSGCIECDIAQCWSPRGNKALVELV